MTKTRGRPKLIDSREQRISVRINEKESNMLDDITEKLNESKSDFIRGSIREKFIELQKSAEETTAIMEGRSE